MRCLKSLNAIAVSCLVLLSGRAIEGQEELPDAAGKAVLLKVCANCHEIETAIGMRRTKLGWQQSVDDMISRGAEGSKEEMETVVAYLTTYFGKVNVNTATVQDLERVLEFSEKEAKAIVSYRERNTKIKDFEELKRVPGVSAEKLQAKRGLIAFSL